MVHFPFFHVLDPLLEHHKPSPLSFILSLGWLCIGRKKINSNPWWVELLRARGERARRERGPHFILKSRASFHFFVQGTLKHRDGPAVTHHIFSTIGLCKRNRKMFLATWRNICDMPSSFQVAEGILPRAGYVL
jgi:hypothetical protein